MAPGSAQQILASVAEQQQAMIAFLHELVLAELPSTVTSHRGVFEQVKDASMPELNGILTRDLESPCPG